MIRALIVIVALLLAGCVQKPTYNITVEVAEGATLNSTITSTTPVDVKPATQVDLDLIPIP